MSGVVVQFPKQQRPKPWAAYEGNCPQCGLTSRIINVRRTHWGYCAEHRLKWFIGENLYSNWRDETEADWRRNSLLLATCVDVEPIDGDDGGAGA